MSAMKFKIKILAALLITIVSFGLASCSTKDSKKTFDYQISHQKEYTKNIINNYQATEGRPNSYLLAIVFYKKNSLSDKLETSIVDAFEANKDIKTLYIDITDGFPDYLKSAMNPNWLQKEKSDKPFALIFYNGNLREPVFAGIFSKEKTVTETKEYLLDMSDLKKRVHAVDVQNGFAEE